MREVLALRSALDRVEIVANESAQQALIANLFARAGSAPVVLDFLNQHAGNMVVANAQFRADFLGADCILRDGIGSRLALSAFGRDAGLNMNGTDLIPKLVRHFSAAYPVAPLLLFGTRQPWLQQGAARLAADHAGPVVLADGFQPPAHYRELAQAHAPSPKLIVLGMGMPRQEQIAQQLQRADIGPALIVCGGAIIDFAAGRVDRAPAWMRAAGLEWLYRLSREPRRLFGRYVIGIPLFLARVVVARRVSRRMPPAPQCASARDAVADACKSGEHR